MVNVMPIMARKPLRRMVPWFIIFSLYWDCSDRPMASALVLGKSNPDIRLYASRYAGFSDPAGPQKNVEFYSGRRPAAQSRDTIEKLLGLKGDYAVLERRHDYIQWLFPIRGPNASGANPAASGLTLEEASVFVSDADIRAKSLRALEMMLDFYGMKIVTDAPTTESSTTEISIQRAAHWQERYANLVHRSHNWLRLTRILKHLGEIEMEPYKVALVWHIAREIHERKQLTPMRDSFINYMAGTIFDEDVRVSLETYLGIQ